MDFPKEFIASTKKNLPVNESSNLFDALSQPPLVSIRLNPKKANTIEVPHEKIEHCSTGYFLKERPLFTADPALHAGAYYPQEANSMWIGEVFSYLKNEFQENPWTVLDMCAAPGGKTTDISSRLDENDLLIANEVISHRNNILFENVCKWGDGNTVISRTDAKVFKQPFTHGMARSWRFCHTKHLVFISPLSVWVSLKCDRIQSFHVEQWHSRHSPRRQLHFHCCIKHLIQCRRKG